jgi:hypothetical protein
MQASSPLELTDSGDDVEGQEDAHSFTLAARVKQFPRTSTPVADRGPIEQGLSPIHIEIDPSVYAELEESLGGPSLSL